MFDQSKINIEEEKDEKQQRVEESSFCGGFCSAYSFNNMLTLYCPLMIKKDIYYSTNVYCKNIKMSPNEFIKMMNK